MFAKSIFSATLSAAALAVAAPSSASVIYSFHETGAFNGDISFTYTAPTFITARVFAIVDSCTNSLIANGCSATQEFAPFPNPFGAGGDFIGGSDNVGGTGFYFFQPGAFNAVGSYTTQGWPNPSNGFGNAGDGFLTVALSGAVPEPASWALMLAGFGLVGAATRRRVRMSVSFA